MESELVSGFMTEHAAVVFVFFFLAEYGSILLMCILIGIFFIGGYLPILKEYSVILDYIAYYLDFMLFCIYNSILDKFYLILQFLSSAGVLSGLSIGLKGLIFVFSFIWIRASFPRIRYDQLMLFTWTVILPLVFTLIIFIPYITHIGDSLPTSTTSLLALPFWNKKKSANKNTG